jgi:hypothetical protein
VKDPILACEVLDIGIRHINAGRRSPLIEREFRLESESTKHDSPVLRVVNNWTAGTRKRSSIGIENLKSNGPSNALTRHVSEIHNFALRKASNMHASDLASCIRAIFRPTWPVSH